MHQKFAASAVKRRSQRTGLREVEAGQRDRNASECPALRDAETHRAELVGSVPEPAVARAIKLAGQAVRGCASERTKLQQLSLLRAMQLGEEAGELREEMVDSMTESELKAEGEAGNSPKYVQAAKATEKRWLLFMAVKGYAKEATPTVEMAKEFTVFLFTTRQRRSLVEREGLGDSAALLSRYTLVQDVFPNLRYEGWTGLSKAELREKGRDFSRT